jgi:cell division protease FtsH
MFGRGLEEREYSDKVGAEIDAEVSRIMGEALKRAEEVVQKHKVALEAITKRLIEVETIEQAEYEGIIVAHGIPVKKKIEL